MDVIINIPLRYPDCVFLKNKNIYKRKKISKLLLELPVQKPKVFF